MIRAANTTKKILRLLLAYLTIAGAVTFTQFILEEAIQTAMFGTWQAKQDPDTRLLGLNLMSSINTTLKQINRYIGWIHPLALLSYQSFSTATDYYIQASASDLLASPSIQNKPIRLTFHWTHADNYQEYTILRSGHLAAKLAAPPKSNPIQLQGVITMSGQTPLIDTTIRKQD